MEKREYASIVLKEQDRRFSIVKGKTNGGTTSFVFFVFLTSCWYYSKQILKQIQHIDMLSLCCLQLNLASE